MQALIIHDVRDQISGLRPPVEILLIRIIPEFDTILKRVHLLFKNEYVIAAHRHAKHQAGRTTKFTIFPWT